jgi:oxygen-independent coproporphyrinogen-3 oxidase
LIYWRYGDYAGVGPGAHGRLGLNGKRMATAAVKLPERWQDGVMKEGRAFSDLVEVNDGEAAREHLMMNLRLAEGIDLAAYEMRWGLRPALEKITPLVGERLLSLSGDVLRATPQGRLVLNALIAALLN